MDDYDSFDRWAMRMSFGALRPNSHVAITGVDGSKRAVAEALAQLEEAHPDEAALLQEHIDCGKSTDPRWND